NYGCMLTPGVGECKLDIYSLRSLRISASSASKRPSTQRTQRYAEKLSSCRAARLFQQNVVVYLTAFEHDLGTIVYITGNLHKQNGSAGGGTDGIGLNYYGTARVRIPLKRDTGIVDGHRMPVLATESEYQFDL